MSVEQNIVEHRAMPKKSRFGLSAWAHAPSTRKRNSKNILNQDLPIFKNVADPFDRSQVVSQSPRIALLEVTNKTGSELALLTLALAEAWLAIKVVETLCLDELNAGVSNSIHQCSDGLG